MSYQAYYVNMLRQTVEDRKREVAELERVYASRPTYRNRIRRDAASSALYYATNYYRAYLRDHGQG